MNTFVDKIMTNHVFNSDSSDDLAYLYSENDNVDNGVDNNTIIKGGYREDPTADTKVSVPTGGFPPIHIIEKTDIEEEEKSKNRELASIKSAVSIQDILKSKKN